MSGLELPKAIRECDETRGLPFIMVTSSAELARVRDAASSGVSDYLIKPFQPAHFWQKVMTILGETCYTPRKYQKSKLLTDPETPDTQSYAVESPLQGTDGRFAIEEILGIELEKKTPNENK